MSNKKTLWILGAGASKHLDLPLLGEFPEFLAQIKYRNLDKADVQEDCDQTLECLASARGDIEELLRQHAVDTDLGKTFRRCIQRSFSLRHEAVFGKRDIPLKYKAYSYMLCLVEQGDSIVTFNYDTSIERTIENANRSLSDHVWQPRVPPECLQHVQDLRYRLVPDEVFESQPCRTGATEFRLVKLHGSINWQWKNATSKLTVHDSKGQGDNTFLVYPDPAKPESKRFPANQLIDAAKELFRQSETIIVAGYSFPKSDSEKHPFVTHLVQELPKKCATFIDPRPSKELLGVAKKTSNGTFFSAKFEDVFSQDTVNAIAHFLDRTPHLSIE